MKVLRIRKDETLSQYYGRLADYYADRPMKREELHKMLRELSITSYTYGSNAAIQAIKNPLRRL
jgi:hypothetical protein